MTLNEIKQATEATLHARKNAIDGHSKSAADAEEVYMICQELMIRRRRVMAGRQIAEVQ